MEGENVDGQSQPNGGDENDLQDKGNNAEPISDKKPFVLRANNFSPSHNSPFLSPLTRLSKLSRIGNGPLTRSPLPASARDKWGEQGEISPYGERDSENTGKQSELSGGDGTHDLGQGWAAEMYDILKGRAKNPKWYAVLDGWMELQRGWEVSEVSTIQSHAKRELTMLTYSYRSIEMAC